jgi:hypothetical protein
MGEHPGAVISRVREDAGLNQHVQRAIDDLNLDRKWFEGTVRGIPVHHVALPVWGLEFYGHKATFRIFG